MEFSDSADFKSLRHLQLQVDHAAEHTGANDLPAAGEVVYYSLILLSEGRGVLLKVIDGIVSFFPGKRSRLACLEREENSSALKRFVEIAWWGGGSPASAGDFGFDHCQFLWRAAFESTEELARCDNRYLGAREGGFRSLRRQETRLDVTVRGKNREKINVSWIRV
ncbi:hypothetical protein PAAG_06770 [Paracoccidioides lutzii Pb01]|uniref:Uncharacterized protein n=1 Tax=Paracoccidioides lutzii (strain ATCC MYA-826 / Pb01) TaxID=502779 RepID=C1H7M9_PARBA|nr:hypothetical protein PAAG_06770 [Paracoccidioides lutzii Pb01]EEH36352.2 hypothetical protein PAAG_06770 [Paracoccidioides lutzii Pb01]